MDIDHKKSIGIIANYIIKYTLLELPKIDFLLGRISECRFREVMSSSPFFEEHNHEQVIIIFRNIKRDPVKTKSMCMSMLRLILSFEEMLENCPDLSKVMDDVNSKGVSTHIKENLRYMKQTIAPDQY